MSDSGSSAATALIAIVAIIVILGLGFFLFQNYASNGNGAPAINVTVPTGQGQ